MTKYGEYFDVNAFSRIHKFIKYASDFGVFAAFRKAYSFILIRNRMRQFVKRNLPDRKSLADQTQMHLPNMPLISIVTPLYNTPLQYLNEMIESVCAQTYGNWQLCLADGSDTENQIEEVIRRYEAKYSGKIKYIRLNKNKGISENTNECIRIADGEYLAFLDHDDILAPNALFEVIKVINESDADVIYTDEAVFSGKITRINTVHLKPNFAIDNLRANNYICHLLVFRKSLLDKVGMFRKECDGSQDHDMILRLSEITGKIVHIPKVLYFWRAHGESVAGDIDSKLYAADAGIRAVSEHLERLGIKAEVESSEWFPFIYRIKYELSEEPLVSVIIVNEGNYDELKECIDSIFEKSTYSKYEIVIINLGPPNEKINAYFDELKRNINVRIACWQQEFNYSAIYNYGVSYSQGKHILFLHPDTKVISPDWIQEMLMYSQRADVGAVGAKLIYSDGTIQHAGIDIVSGRSPQIKYIGRGLPIHDGGYMGTLFYSRKSCAVTIACMMVKRKLYDEVGGLDEKFASDYGSLDFCLKLYEYGYSNIFTPYSKLYHYDKRLCKYCSDIDETRDIALFNARWSNFLH